MKMLIIIALALALGVAAIWAADFEPGFHWSCLPPFMSF